MFTKLVKRLHSGNKIAKYSAWREAAISFVRSAAFKYFGTSAVTFLILFLRRPDSLTNSQFWAEDALVYFHDQAVSQSAAIALPHLGYLVVFQRCIAELVAFFPSSSAPLIYNVVALIAASMSCAFFVLPVYRYVLASDAGRMFAALLFAGVPFSRELIGNVTNLQWYLGLGALIIVMFPFKHFQRLNLAQRGAVTFLAVVMFLSSPNTVIFAPIAVWQVLRARRFALMPCALLACNILQIATYLVASRSEVLPATTGLHALSGAHGIAQTLFATIMALDYRSIMASILGEPATEAASGFHLWYLPLLALALFTVIVLQAFRVSRGLHRTILVFSLYVLLASVAIALIDRNLTLEYTRLYGVPEWGNERYFFLASCIFIYFVFATVERSLKWRVRGFDWRPAARLGVPALLFAGGIFGNFEAPAYADLRWNTYTPAIDAWRHAHSERRAVQGVTVPINPGGPWFLELPSDRTGAPTVHQ